MDRDCLLTKVPLSISKYSRQSAHVRLATLKQFFAHGEQSGSRLTSVRWEKGADSSLPSVGGRSEPIRHVTKDTNPNRRRKASSAAIYLLMPLKRTCPSCGEELIYANVAGYQRATRTKALCRECAASPSVVQKKLAEAENRAAENSQGNFMAAFFEKLETSLSGSRGR